MYNGSVLPSLTTVFLERFDMKIKQTVVGVGRADKDQVQHMVKILLNLQNKLQEDEADALAVAITHAHLGLSIKQSL